MAGAHTVMTMPDTERPPDAQPSVSAPRRRRGALTVALAAGLLLLLAGSIAWGIRARLRADAALKQTTARDADPVVNVVYPKRGASTEEIVLPGNTQAFTDSPIYARTSGYLRKWYFDIGSRVKQGQLLAEIETPEVDERLRQARADLETAKANLGIAEVTAERWQRLWATKSVSKQETDQFVSNAKAMKATVESNIANVRRLEQLQSFEKVYAPFDGIVTARNIDVGTLIDAGANPQSRELFHMTAIHTLRVFVAVPEVYAQAGQPGTLASLTLDEFPGRSFRGHVVRTSNSIDPAARTLLVEVDVDNPNGELLPGAYVRVHLPVPGAAQAVTIPANTLLFRSEGLRVGVVRNGRAELVRIKIGRDYGDAVEVLTGLNPGDAVITNPSDSLTSGTPVRIQTGTTQKGAP
jgi:RND family efflux transporter MFP subunit